MRYYVISDVHGYYTQMKSALEKAGFFSDTTPHKLIMLGDLFDRGHEAKQLQQFILEQMEQDKIILIRGNHEDLFVELVTTDAGMPYSYHKSNGTYDTALQLTGFDPVMASIRHYDFADAAKDTPFYKEIIPATLDYFETEHYVFTHGWIPSIPNRDKSYSYISSWREADREQWNQARWFNGMDAWMQHRPQMRIRPLFADTGILRMAIANTNTRGPSLEKMRTSLPIMVPELLP